MMSAEHQFALQILFGLIAVLFLVIVGTLVLSQRKRRREEIAAREVGPEILPKEAAEEGEPVAAAPPVEEEAPAVELKLALRNTQASFIGRIRSLFQAQPNPHLEDIEEILYTSDIGSKTVQDLLTTIEDLPSAEQKSIEGIQSALRAKMLSIFEQASHHEIRTADQGPTVLMIVGVNGAGKTTTIGKLSAKAASDGKKVLVAAGDTFRAAAGAQLKVWSDRAQVDIFSPEGITDPGAVAHDAVAKAMAQNFDLVLIDTAGRLHTQSNLMEELKKVKRVIQKQNPQAPHEVLIVLDANSGQNALVQAREFHKALGLTGAILTKMDGTAKGGVALGLADELQIPIKMIGVGERVQDLRPFSAEEYVDAIF